MGLTRNGRIHYFLTGFLIVAFLFVSWFRTSTSARLIISQSSIQSSSSAATETKLSKNCASNLKLYIYKPISEKLLFDEQFPTGNKSVLLSRSDDYLLEDALLRYFQHQPCIITSDPTQANAFLVPHAIASHFFNVPNANQHNLESYFDETLRPFLKHIQQDLPYFNQSISGSDISKNHFFLNTFDNGPFCDKNKHTNESGVFSHKVWKEVVAPMMQIGYYSQLDQKIPHNRQSKRRKFCFIPEKDIAVPMYDEQGRNSLNQQQPAQPTSTAFIHHCNHHSNNDYCRIQWRSYLKHRALQVSRPFYFRGTISKGKQCSPGIRPFLQRYCSLQTTSCHFQNLSASMKDSIFSFCPAGWACWSARFYDAWDHMTIPIRLSEDIAEPFASVIPEYSKMMISLRTTSISGLFEIMHANNNSQTMPKNGSDLLNKLAFLAREWVHVCAAANNTTFDNNNACLQHPISKRLEVIAKNRHLVSWAQSEEGGAYTSLEREMSNRVRNN
mmetsp:Transcript_15121/g.23216  ORF Transcript_15121/g.23216 Transcript_15121/m.23216 type:complete len:500 (+) Transcript_15121:47-1546(+)